MPPEQLDEIKSVVSDATKEITSKLDTQIKDATKELATKAQMEADKKETTEKLNTLGNQVDDLSKKVEKGGNGGENPVNHLDEYQRKVSKIAEARKVALADDENAKPKAEEFSVELPVAKSMTTSGALSAGQIFLTTTDKDGETYRAPKNPNKMLDMIRVFPTNGATLSTRYRSTVTGAPVTVAEDGAYPEEQLTWVEELWKPKKIAVFAEPTAEMIEDTDYVNYELPIELQEDTLIALNAQVFTGSGAGNNITGLKTIATSFTKPAGLTALVGATKYDVLRAIITLIVKNGFGLKSGYVAIFLNPTDMYDLEVKKDSTGQYILPPFMSTDNTKIKGVAIIEDNNVTAGDFFGGDFAQTKLRMKRQMEYKMFEQDAQNAKNDIYTCTVSLRAALVTPFPARKAFITGTFSTAITALQT